jgi:hypothetical protein
MGLKANRRVLVSYKPLARERGGTMEAAPGGRYPLKLAHCRTGSSAHGLELPMEADRGPTPTSHLGLALWPWAGLSKRHTYN